MREVTSESSFSQGDRQCPRVLPRTLGAGAGVDAHVAGEAAGTEDFSQVLGNRNWYLPQKLHWLPRVSHGTPALNS